MQKLHIFCWREIERESQAYESRRAYNYSCLLGVPSDFLKTIESTRQLKRTGPNSHALKILIASIDKSFGLLVVFSLLGFYSVNSVSVKNTKKKNTHLKNLVYQIPSKMQFVYFELAFYQADPHGECQDSLVEEMLKIFIQKQSSHILFLLLSKICLATCDRTTIAQHYI